VRGERRREEVTTRLQWRTSGGMEPRGERERRGGGDVGWSEGGGTEG
jgi:hypothetical protein